MTDGEKIISFFLYHDFTDECFTLHDIGIQFYESLQDLENKYLVERFMELGERLIDDFQKLKKENRKDDEPDKEQ